MVLLTRNTILSLDRIGPFLSQRYIPRKLVQESSLCLLCVGVASRYTTSIASSQSFLRDSVV